MAPNSPAVRTVVHATTAIEACLRGELTAPADCSASHAAHWRRSGCLRSRVPAWTSTHEQVQGCFRCCMEATWSSRATRSEWWREQMKNSSQEMVLGLETEPGVLLSANTDLQFADVGMLHGREALETPPPTPAATSGSQRPTLAVLHGNGKQEPPLLSLLAQSKSSLRVPMTVVEVGDVPLPTTKATPVLDQPGTVAAWFVNNPRIQHPKVHAYPRGVQNTPRWWQVLRNSMRQLRRERPQLLMCMCFHPRRPGRQRKMDLLAQKGFECKTHAKECGNTRTAYMDRLLESKFVFSPQGMGMNNHRDWEALLAGAVPLVDYHAELEPMWETLPVVRVRDWANVTPAFLETEWERLHLDASLEWTRIYLPFWLDRLLHAVDGAAPHKSVESKARISVR